MGLILGFGMGYEYQPTQYLANPVNAALMMTEHTGATMRPQRQCVRKLGDNFRQSTGWRYLLQKTQFVEIGATIPLVEAGILGT